MNQESLEWSPEEDLSPQTVQLLGRILANLPKAAGPAPLDVSSAVRYACGGLERADAEDVEHAASTRNEDRQRLLEANRAVSRFRRLTLPEIQTLALAGEGISPFAASYLEIATQSSESLETGLISLIRRGAQGARAAYAALQATVLASEAMPKMAGIYRSGGSAAILEGGGRMEVSSTPEEIRLRFPDFSGNGRCFVSLDTSLGRLRLCGAAIEDGIAHLPVDSEMSEAARLVVRLESWPEGEMGIPILCFVDDEASPAFASCAKPAVVVDRSLSLSLQWENEVGLRGPGELEVSYGTGPDQWQHLGKVRVLEPSGTLDLKFGYPGPDMHLYLPFKLTWRSDR